jgi:hypothetical protein
LSQVRGQQQRPGRRRHRPLRPSSPSATGLLGRAGGGRCRRARSRRRRPAACGGACRSGAPIANRLIAPGRELHASRYTSRPCW